MLRSWIVILLVTLFGVAFLSAGSAQAQSCQEPPCDGFDPGSSILGGSSYEPARAPENLSSDSTRAIVRILEGANATCDRRIELRYRIDCLRIYYGWVAAGLPDRGDYLPIKKAMLAAEAKLEAIVLANLDDSAPALRPHDKHKPAAKRLPKVRAVKEDKAKIAAEQAAKVVQETELIILRSGGDPARRTEHYTKVAAAVEDNLVILRSA